MHQNDKINEKERDNFAVTSSIACKDTRSVSSIIVLNSQEH